jgi:hypothetical protein
MTVSENVYDGSGMRVKKVEDGKTVYYVYNGHNPIVEFSANDSKFFYYINAGNQTVKVLAKLITAVKAVMMAAKIVITTKMVVDGFEIL